MLLGAHESIAGRLALAFERAADHSAECLQIFTKSARGWTARPIDPAEAAAFRAEARRTGLPVIAHASYLVNLAAEPGPVRSKSVAALADELTRCEQLSVPYLVLHPGSHPDPDRGIALVAQGLDDSFAATSSHTAILVENTAGQGSSLGHRAEHLARILEGCRHSERLGICLDTCHLFAAGYDFASPAGYRKVMRHLDDVVGLSLVRALHLNDCKKPLGSRVDRHEEIGEGFLGLSAFEPLVDDPRFSRALGVIETPAPERYKENLRRLRGLRRAVPRRATAKRAASRP